VPSAGHPIERLTKRQREVLRLMAQGLANKEIATELGISTETARTHAAAILSGLGVENRTEATATYLRWSPRLDRAEVVLARPAIAVLPIPATGAKAAPLLAQALARELTSLLSRWCHFPVIAHAATRDPRGLGDTTAEIGARLGARFLVDGALTCWRQRWRLTMHVVDASTSRLVWTEHLDLTPRRWFATQDQVCARLVASAYPRLIAAVHPPLASDSPGDPASVAAHARRVRPPREPRSQRQPARSRHVHGGDRAGSDVELGPLRSRPVRLRCAAQPVGTGGPGARSPGRGRRPLPDAGARSRRGPLPRGPAPSGARGKHDRAPAAIAVGDRGQPELRPRPTRCWARRCCSPVCPTRG
jgi:TolB-like protein